MSTYTAFCIMERKPNYSFLIKLKSKMLTFIIVNTKPSSYPKKTIILAHSVMRRKREKRKRTKSEKESNELFK